MKCICKLVKEGRPRKFLKGDWISIYMTKDQYNTVCERLEKKVK